MQNRFSFLAMKLALRAGRLLPGPNVPAAELYESFHAHFPSSLPPAYGDADDQFLPAQRRVGVSQTSGSELERLALNPTQHDEDRIPH